MEFAVDGFFFGDIHYITNYHVVVILLFVFLEVLHSVVFYRFITEWSDQPDLCNVNGDQKMVSNPPWQEELEAKNQCLNQCLTSGFVEWAVRKMDMFRLNST